MTEKSVTRAGVLVLSFIVLAVTVRLCLHGGVKNRAAVDASVINRQLAEYAVTEYELMYHHGAAWDRCAQARVVVAGYLQAKDDTNYQAWRRIEAADCTLAGILR